MGNEIYEIVAEYYINVSGMDEKVKAKVCKVLTEGESTLYTYSFSHYFIPGEGGEYFDETIVRQDFETAKILALQYLESFTIEFGDPQPNKFY